MIPEAEKLFELVTQRPDRSLRQHNVNCPFCDSKNTSRSSMLQTSTFTPHTWIDSTCAACSKKFVIETRNHEVWVTGEKGKVLRGFPNCFEDYVYTCAACGSDIVRKNMNRITKEETDKISYHRQENGSFVSEQFERYVCISCNAFVDIDC